MGIAYLGAMLERNNHDVKLFDFFHAPLDTIKNEFLKEVESGKPEIIGFSILSMNRTANIQIDQPRKNILG